MEIFNFFSCGLLFCAIGVLSFGHSFFMDNPNEKQDAQAVLRKSIALRLDGINGTILLTTGFTLQFIASLGYSSLEFSQLLYIALIGWSGAYSLGFRARKIDHLVEKAGCE